MPYILTTKVLINLEDVIWDCGTVAVELPDEAINVLRRQYAEDVAKIDGKQEFIDYLADVFGDEVYVETEIKEEK